MTILKKRNLKIIIPIIIFLFLILIILCFQNSNFRIAVYDTNYKVNSSYENLSKLCLNLRFTNEYEKKYNIFQSSYIMKRRFLV